LSSSSPASPRTSPNPHPHLRVHRGPPPIPTNPSPRTRISRSMPTNQSLRAGVSLPELSSLRVLGSVASILYAVTYQASLLSTRVMILDLPSCSLCTNCVPSQPSSLGRNFYHQKPCFQTTFASTHQHALFIIASTPSHHIEIPHASFITVPQNRIRFLHDV
jgi:hypothetical protein